MKFLHRYLSCNTLNNIVEFLKSVSISLSGFMGKYAHRQFSILPKQQVWQMGSVDNRVIFYHLFINKFGLLYLGQSCAFRDSCFLHQIGAWGTVDAMDLVEMILTWCSTDSPILCIPQGAVVKSKLIALCHFNFLFKMNVVNNARSDNSLQYINPQQYWCLNSKKAPTKISWVKRGFIISGYWDPFFILSCLHVAATHWLTPFWFKQ